MAACAADQKVSLQSCYVGSGTYKVTLKVLPKQKPVHEQHPAFFLANTFGIIRTWYSSTIEVTQEFSPRTVACGAAQALWTPCVFPMRSIKFPTLKHLKLQYDTVSL